MSSESEKVEEEEVEDVDSAEGPGNEYEREESEEAGEVQEAAAAEDLEGAAADEESRDENEREEEDVGQRSDTQKQFQKKRRRTSDADAAPEANEARQPRRQRQRTSGTDAVVDVDRASQPHKQRRRPGETADFEEALVDALGLADTRAADTAPKPRRRRQEAGETNGADAEETPRPCRPRRKAAETDDPNAEKTPRPRRPRRKAAETGEGEWVERVPTGGENEGKIATNVRGPRGKYEKAAERDQEAASHKLKKKNGLSFGITFHVAFSMREKQAIVLAADEYAAEHNLTVVELMLSIPYESETRGKVGPKALKTIRNYAIEKCPSIRQRNYIAIWKYLGRQHDESNGLPWSMGDRQRLLDLFAEHGPSWVKLGKVLKRDPVKCRLAWISIDSKWCDAEDWALREGILETTGQLTPNRFIPWKRVAVWLPHRTTTACCHRWYNGLLERLLAYKSQNGHPISTDVLDRDLLRRIGKSGVDDEEEIPWPWISKWRSATANKGRWKLMKRMMPHSMVGDPDVSLQDRLQYVSDMRKVRENRKFDRRLLKHARSAQDYDAEQAENDNGDQALEEEEDKISEDADEKEEDIGTPPAEDEENISEDAEEREEADGVPAAEAGGEQAEEESSEHAEEEVESSDEQSAAAEGGEAPDEESSGSGL